MSANAHALTHAEILAQESKHYHAFITLALFLSVFTGIEIVIIFMPFPYWVLMSTLVTLSVTKFICVILWFMHLIYDAPLLTILFLGGMVLAGGTMVALLGLMATEDVDPAILGGNSFNPNPPAHQLVLDSPVVG